MNPVTAERRNVEAWMDGKVCLLQLQEGVWAKVSEQDYARCAEHRWAKFKNKGEVYKVRMVVQHKQIPTRNAFGVALHRFVLELEPGDGYVRFRNSDGLDCRRSNLQIVPRALPVQKQKLIMVQLPTIPSPCGVMVQAGIGKRCRGFWDIVGGCSRYDECLDKCIEQGWMGDSKQLDCMMGGESMRQADGMGAIGKHGFDGSCAPGSTAEVHYGQMRTFSLGIFEYLPKSGGKGVKRGKVKVRVSGPYTNADGVYATAREILCQLDDGTYSGPKHVRVKP